MSKPLHSENAQPRDLQFTHFGVLNAGEQSKASLVTSVVFNALLLMIVIILGAATKRTIERRDREITFVVPLAKPPEPIPPKIIPPKIIPPRPAPMTVEPKIVLPKVEPLVVPKPMPVSLPKPLPVVTPAPPKLVVAAAAPKPMPVNLGKSASVINHDTHPAPVALGQVNNPIAPSNRPSTASVNLGNRGMAGMPPGTGGGPASSAVNLGSGQPNGSLSGTGSRAVAGVKLGGVTGGTGTTPGNGIGSRPAQVSLGQAPPPPPATNTSLARAPVRTGPQVVFKPRPAYTAEATAMHLEGVVSVRIRVSSAGSVSVLGVTNGLGHGLDESAVRAVQGTRFRPAVDSSGNPTDWEGVVNISFQMAA